MRADTRGDRTFCMSVTTAIAVHMNLQLDLRYTAQYAATASEASAKRSLNWIKFQPSPQRNSNLDFFARSARTPACLLAPIVSCLTLDSAFD